jgi:peptide/nickel transport system substrate-binding protein
LRTHPWQSAGVCIALIAAVVIGVHHFTAAVPTSGGTFTEGTVGQLQIVNPVLATSEIDKQVSRLVFSPLRDLTATSSVTFSKTQQVWHVSLKPDAEWADGKPITAADVLFTVHAIQDPQSNSPLASSWESVSVDRTSDHDLTFTAPASYGYFKDTLDALAPVPLHVYQGLSYAAWADGDHALTPVGSGPFQFKKKTLQNDMVTEYHLAAATTTTGQKPYIQEFVWKFFATNDDLAKSFDRGAIDGMVLLDPDAQSQVHAPHTTTNFTLQNYYAVFANPSKNEALRDIQVRQALQNALHKDDVLKLVPGATWFLDNASATPDEPAKLLAAAGWQQENGGWYKHGAKGATTQLTLTLTVPDITFLKHTADYVAQQWQASGIPTQTNIVPVATLMSDAIPNRTYELLLFGNIVSPPDDLFPFWHSSQRFHPGLNLALYSSKQVDTIVEQIRSASNASDRDRLFTQAKARLAADLPAIFLYETPYTYVTASRVHGVTGGTIVESSDRFNTVQQWYVKTHRMWR